MTNFALNLNVVEIDRYMEWLKAEMSKRLEMYFATTYNGTIYEPGLPPDPLWAEAPINVFIEKHNLSRDAILVLLLALAPYINPEFFDALMQAHVDEHNKGDFPATGFVKSTQGRGLLPTGETALFLLAGTDLMHRLDSMELFETGSLFAKLRVLWLESVPGNEPPFSGKITISEDYVSQFLTGKLSKPKFGNDFPAESITTPLTWEDLVLNAQTMEQLEELKKWLRLKDQLGQVDHRLKPGYRALFYGPPGTGKTLSACLLGKYGEVPGNEFEIENGEGGIPVFRIDLSLVVSKFIGETEKNLSNLFDKAEHKNWILFFDEADALFGKRTGVRDAHDKYANQEIAYLLQRIENYNGLVILATNFKNNIDPAFSRRFQSIIQFPMPNQAERYQLWSKILTPDRFPQQDVLERIAAQYEVSGASIINVAHYCFLKSMGNDGALGVISAATIEEGLIREFNKEGKIFKT
ncbi:ATPase family protein associated with various cellular activities (AAA) [Chitinophaga skermanii]|uniref:ATPase family protein associated with various cellular activities (AAA) n=1 Tax=Chitinophaga skermanii TaxID=331697 RepID=A0A327QS52_9BACT|nr:ATP-binding protein [Chitinophaga skermanii]RAJ06522.1 ATPase family protein associated with various cellular activities (AAA) [Chitinophaga skermanii]